MSVLATPHSRDLAAELAADNDTIVFTRNGKLVTTLQNIRRDEEHAGGGRQRVRPHCVPKDVEMAKRALIYDVAAAAAVSVSTVSNVMNRPSTVAGPTRERVLLVISELGYERDENAALLRLGKKVIRRQPPSGLPAHDPVPTLTPSKGTDVGPADGGTSALLSQDWRKFPLSGAVHIASYGQEVGGGIVEASLLDGSGAWVRFDDGRGRLLLMQEDGYSLCSKNQAK